MIWILSFPVPTAPGSITTSQLDRAYVVETPHLRAEFDLTQGGMPAIRPRDPLLPAIAQMNIYTDWGIYGQGSYSPVSSRNEAEPKLQVEHIDSAILVTVSGLLKDPGEVYLAHPLRYSLQCLFSEEPELLLSCALATDRDFLAPPGFLAWSWAIEGAAGWSAATIEGWGTSSLGLGNFRVWESKREPLTAQGSIRIYGHNWQRWLEMGELKEPQAAPLENILLHDAGNGHQVGLFFCYSDGLGSREFKGQEVQEIQLRLLLQL